MHLGRLVTSGLVLTAAVLAARSAAAAPAAPCTPSTMIPAVTQVPANFPGFAYDAPKATSSNVHLFDIGTQKTEVPLTVGAPQQGLVKVAPTSSLTAGHAYELDYDSFCYTGPGTPLTFQVVAAQPLPTMLGSLQGTPTATTHDFGTTQYQLVAQLAVADEMKPWLGIYRLGVVLDGDVIETHATASGGSNMQVNALGWCNAKNATAKTHTLQMQASLPFAPTITTDSVQIAFDCPAPALVTPGPAMPVDPGPGNGGAGGSGSGSGDPSGGGGATMSSTSGSGSHGGCNAGSTPATPFATLAAGLGLVALARATRRSKKRTTKPEGGDR